MGQVVPCFLKPLRYVLILSFCYSDLLSNCWFTFPSSVVVLSESSVDGEETLRCRARARSRALTAEQVSRSGGYISLLSTSASPTHNPQNDTRRSPEVRQRAVRVLHFELRASPGGSVTVECPPAPAPDREETRDAPARGAGRSAVVATAPRPGCARVRVTGAKPRRAPT